MVKFKFRYAKDFMYSAAGLIIMNAVLQLLVYPQINVKIGEKDFGVVLYLLAVVSLISNGLGVAMNNTRVLNEKKYKLKNGDYNWLSVLFSAVSIVIGLLVLYFYDLFNAENIIMFSIVIVFTILRCYSECEFKINLDFKKYFYYYVILSAGYVIGLLVFNAWSVWYIVFILGEFMCVFWVMLRGNIYKRPNFERSENASVIAKGTIIIAASYIISSFFLSVDRIILANVLDGHSVTVYYVSSLLGKTLALIVAPLNGVILSYLAGYKESLTVRQFMKIIGMVGLVSAGFLILCVLISPWLIGLLYPNIKDDAMNIIWLATSAQIFYFASSLLLVIVLKFCAEKYQIIIQAVYGAAYIAAAIPATIYYSLMGFTYAALFANALLFALVAIIGIMNSAKKKRALE